MAVALYLEHGRSLEEISIQRGMDGYNRIHGYEPPDELAGFVRDEAGRVRGGVQGDLGGNWLYVDLLWLDETRRGSGDGRRLMAAIEAAAAARGAPNIYLATTSFQALDFYAHIGYTLFGQLADRPPGHAYYYLKKRVVVADSDPEIPITGDPDPEDVAAVREGLRQHSIGQGVKVDAQRLAVYARDEAGRTRGGLIAATYWGWLDLQLLWLDESVRGQGSGARMLALAEGAAVERGCPHVVLDVADFQSAGFFKAQGYTAFATLDDYPPPHTRHFLRKDL
jgi:GNAT superfamily N-acetyltransferase